ncbi:unnamed protein product [Kluyveromyces dobzhanskii CBS 2104]|uniref:WGS project CCBQ000000000 data, contig 00006 n=1 Tax=Kluyveromyces dobzhanskii CBS 2104 TaxID=1427455 RepID=A0A0A8LA98_9SACH|nr:unnamed protein product [Kluyveromyces dobzhanskii CBS 2104]
MEITNTTASEHSLQHQLSTLKRKNIENEDLSDLRQEATKRPIAAELGKKSIFYDPEWNPMGRAPFGLKNIPYNPRTFKRNTEVEPRLNGLDNIPLPKEDQKTKGT